MGETLFSLVYETEAIIPVDINMPTLRVAASPNPGSVGGKAAASSDPHHNISTADSGRTLHEGEDSRILRELVLKCVIQITRQKD